MIITSAILLLIILIQGYSLRVFNKLFYAFNDLNKRPDYFVDCYLAVVTFSTVGYGVYIPETFESRVIVILTFVLGTYLIDIISSNLLAFMEKEGSY